MKTCSKSYESLPFAHRQWNHAGHCRLIHGHNWTFEFEFTATALNENHFVVDFGKLKWLKEWINVLFDHTCVLSHDDPLICEFYKVGGNDVWNITSVPDASAEGLSQFLFTEVNRMMNKIEDYKNRGVRVIKVIVREDSKNFATYSE